MIVGRWIGAAVSLFLFGLLITANIRPKQIFQSAVLSFAACNIIITVYGILQCCGFLVPYGYFRITAGFDNPAGMSAALVSTFPFVIYVLSRRIGMMMLSCTLFLVESALLYLVGTRAGMISLSVAFVLSVRLQFSNRCSREVIIIIAVLISLATIALFVRKVSSTYGRSLIMRCSISLAMKHPLFGAGPGGFRRLYMSYQAEWLSIHGSPSLSMLADDVSHPLCEYLLILVDYGIIGLIVVLTCLTATLVHAFGDSLLSAKISYAAIASIATLSAFSYPFRYPLTLGVVVITVICIWGDYLCKLPMCLIRTLSRLMAAAYCFTFIFLIVPWMKAQSEWKIVSDRTSVGDVSETVIKEYEKLESCFNRDPYFLYNEATAYHLAGSNENALRAVKLSLEVMSCYYSVLLKGDIESDLPDFDSLKSLSL